jgi:hypothetical protein
MAVAHTIAHRWMAARKMSAKCLFLFACNVCSLLHFILIQIVNVNFKNMLDALYDKVLKK